MYISWARTTDGLFIYDTIRLECLSSYRKYQLTNTQKTDIRKWRIKKNLTYQISNWYINIDSNLMLCSIPCPYVMPYLR